LHCFIHPFYLFIPVSNATLTFAEKYNFFCFKTTIAPSIIVSSFAQHLTENLHANEMSADQEDVGSSRG